MGDTTARLRRDWQEPAHSMLVRHHDDLVAIHRVIRETFQPRVDEAFDRVSQQIGWVVAMTIPVTLTAAKGKVRSVELAAEHLKGTLFEKEMGGLVAEMAKADFPLLKNGDPILACAATEPVPEPAKRAKDPTPEPARVAYDFRLIWANALRVKLRTEWLEPAHFRPWLEPAHQGRPWLEPAHFGDWWRRRWRIPGRDWLEPVHWVLEPHPDPWREGPLPDPWKERVLVSVLDEVYPELQLIERVASLKGMLRRRWPVGPDVPEPAHYLDVFRRLDPEVLEQLARVVARRWRVGPDVEEPAHFRDVFRQLDPRVLEELVRVVRRRVPPEVEEPAHVPGWSRRLTPEIIQEIDAVLRRYGI